MDQGGFWPALIAALVVLINAARDVLSLYIRARHKWTNGEKPNRETEG